MKIPGYRSLAAYFVVYVAVMLLSLLTITSYATREFRTFYISRLTQDLEHRAYLVSSQAPLELLEDESEQVISRFCESLGQQTKTRLTFIANDGRVICDSEAEPSSMDNHANRPEVGEALGGKVGSRIRQSATLRADFLYVAVPLKHGRELKAVMRAAFSLQSIDAYIHRLVRNLAVCALLITTLAALVSLLFYRLIIPPLEQMRRDAKRFARGKFDRKLPNYHLEKIDELASDMNQMGEQLEKLEQVRSEFVANVSHELKTPITSIKGFVETLREGAKDNPEDAARFLEIISRQADRLIAIVEDLLTLGKLESERVGELVKLQEEHLDGIISSVVDDCASFASTKEIKIEVDCSFGMIVKVDRPLIEQAIMNLIDNAIKYSGNKSSVWVQADSNASETKIIVRDEGPGIAAEHFGRIFERFYRVDKARSRELGGTGLGLAVVKHVANVHSGKVSVESTLGKGSTFIIQLPTGF